MGLDRKPINMPYFKPSAKCCKCLKIRPCSYYGLKNDYLCGVCWDKFVDRDEDLRIVERPSQDKFDD